MNKKEKKFLDEVLRSNRELSEKEQLKMLKMESGEYLTTFYLRWGGTLTLKAQKELLKMPYAAKAMKLFILDDDLDDKLYDKLFFLNMKSDKIGMHELDKIEQKCDETNQSWAPLMYTALKKLLPPEEFSKFINSL